VTRSDGDTRHSAADELEAETSAEVRERLTEQEPSEDKKDELLADHWHHLVRFTTSRLSVEAGKDLPGVEVDATAEVPDAYCFSCDEWVGLSGVDLRGTPRSTADAQYLGGPPDDVLAGRESVRRTVASLCDHIAETVESVNGTAEAFEWVETELDGLDAETVAEYGHTVDQEGSR
jgi:hypothetical protein